MSLFRAAVAAAALTLVAIAPAGSAAPLSLDAAMQLVITTHPDLAVFRARQAALAAERDRAAQAAPLALGVEAENLLGSGRLGAFDAAELTLSLSSLFERGGKREARIAIAERRVDATELLREARQIDVLAEVARRYLDVVAAVALTELTAVDVAQRERTLAAARQRVEAGGAPDSVRLASRSAQLRAEGEHQRARQAQHHARRRLALLWGGEDTDFSVDASPLRALPAAVDYRELSKRLEQHPELRVFASEARIREARLQLARSERVADLEWQVGLRRLQEGSDWALTAGVSLPLGQARRAEPAIGAIEAELDALAFEREGTRLALSATLAEACARLEAAIAEASQLERELIPTLREAEAAAEQAYRRGALGYLEWAQLQGEIIAAERQRLAASVDAQRALIELQRLSGESLRPASTTNPETSP